MNIIKQKLNTKHKFSESDLSLYSQAGSFGMWKAWHLAGVENLNATYDVVVRELPQHRNFMIFTGLDEAITDILNWKFSRDDIKRLLDAGLVTKEMARELKKFHFQGDIWAMKEGTVFFPGEPVMRFTGPLWQLELLYLYIVNVVSSNTIFSTKCIRTVLSAKGKSVILPVTRAQAFESGFKCMRGLYIVGGSPSSSQLSFWRKYNLELPKKILNALTHSYIKSFDSEIEAMRAFAKAFSNDEAVILVDTYDFENGVKNFITVGLETKKKGGKLGMMYIDSGDLAKRSIYARKELDNAGLNDVRILLSGNINEESMAQLHKDHAQFDGVLLITELVSSPDSPKLEVVYKMAEMQHGKKIRYVMKLSKSKKSYPGKKQVWRIKNSKGIMLADTIALGNEKLKGEKLLEPFVVKGKLVSYLPPLEEIRTFCKTQIDSLPENLKKLTIAKPYPVSYSKEMIKLAKKTAKEMH